MVIDTNMAERAAAPAMMTKAINLAIYNRKGYFKDKRRKWQQMLATLKLGV
jgi:hypothetical protein